MLRKLLEKTRRPGFLRDATRVLLVNVLGTVLAFLSNVLLARILGVQSYGYYIYTLTLVALIAPAVLIGLNSSVLKLVSEYTAKNEWGLLNGLFKFIGIVGLASSLCLFLAAALTVLFGDTYLDGGFTRLLAAGLVLLAITAVLVTETAALRALGYPTISQFAEVNIRHIIVISLALLVFVYTRGTFQAWHAIAANAIAGLIALAFTTYWLWKKRPIETMSHTPEMRLREWTAISLSLMFLSGSQILLRETDILMVGAFEGADAAGIYGAAVKLSSLAGFGLMVANIIVAPSIAALHARGDHQKVQRLLTTAALWSTVLAVGLSVPLVVGATLALSVFGPEFIPGTNALRLLVLGQILNATGGSVGYVLAMTGYHTQATKAFLLFVPLNIALNAILIPRIGIAGAAASTAVTKLAWNVVLVLFAVKYLRLNPSVASVFKN